MREFIPPDATRDVLRAIVADPTNTGFEFLEPPSPSLLAAVDEEIFARRPDMRLSIRNRNGPVLDLSILEGLPSLQRLKLSHTGPPPADLHRVCAVPRLIDLYLGEFGLNDYDFLGSLPTRLEHFGLGEPPRGKRSFAFLSRLKNLRTLSLVGPAAHLECVGELPHLTQLHLKSVSPPSLEFLSPLQELEAFKLSLGGTRSLKGLEALQTLEYLEIWQVRKLSDLTPLQFLHGLKSFSLQALQNVKSLPSLARLTRLTTVWLDTMKGLRDFRGLAKAPNLLHFTFIAAANCQPSDFTPLLNHATLKTMRVGFGSQRTNDMFKQMMAAAGKRYPVPPTPGSPAQPHN